jgi:pyruvate/2-oxoglutarate dehydrogenase complex dihydrolipoamide acyltransferase (E2) component
MKQATTWTVSLVLLALLLGALYWWQLEQRSGPPSAAIAPAAPAAPAASAARSAEPAPPSATPAIQYPIDAAPSTATHASAPAAPPATTLAQALTEVFGERTVLQWFNSDALAHRVAATVDNLARPHAPARFWPVHPTPGRFATEPTGVIEAISSANSKRYTPFVAWVETLEMRQVVSLYRRFYPQFQRAYESLGYPGRYFNDRVIAVIDHLLDTPRAPEPLEVRLANVKGPIQPTRPWVMVEFADPDLEERSAGQKLMLRIGNDNARRLKAKLTELRAALTPPR